MFLCHILSFSFCLLFPIFRLYLSPFIHNFKSFFYCFLFFSTNSCHIVVVKEKIFYSELEDFFFHFLSTDSFWTIFSPIKPWELTKDFLIFHRNQPKNTFDVHITIPSTSEVSRCLLRSRPCEASQAELLLAVSPLQNFGGPMDTFSCIFCSAEIWFLWEDSQPINFTYISKWYGPYHQHHMSPAHTTCAQGPGRRGHFVRDSWFPCRHT